MGTPVLTRAARIDAILGRLSGSSVESALKQYLAAMKTGGPGELEPVEAIFKTQRTADTLPAVSEWAAQEGVKQLKPLGGGWESIVFDAGDGRVLKVGANSAAHAGASNLPPQGYAMPDIPGVAPYTAARIFNDRVRAGLQPKASIVGLTDGESGVGRWMRMVNDLQDSLNRRGYSWNDGMPQNMGVMASGDMAVIDGTVRPMVSPVPLRLLEIYPTAEDAIRALRVPLDGASGRINFPAMDAQRLIRNR